MRYLSFLLLLFTGLAMAVPGIYLAALGGSLYYVIAGLLILISAVLVLQRHPFGVMLFWLVFLGTAIWSIWEVGLDGWALMPRLVYLAIVALWLLFLPRRDGETRSSARFAAVLLFPIIGLAGAIGVASLDRSAFAQPAVAVATDTGNGEWTHYGNSLHGTRYSDLTQITSANAGHLEQAWVYHSGLRPPGKLSADLLEATPLMVDGMLYSCTGYSAVFALDPVTGRQIWRHDTKIDPNYGGRGVCRGVSFFRAPPGTGECPTRILFGTVDNRLLALDAKTGAPCRSFGDNGEVDLSQDEGLDRFPHGWINPTSPPAIVHGTAVIGSYIIDDQSIHVPPGVIRGYDAVTGQLKWVFDPGRPDDHAPMPGRTYVESTPNSWSAFSGDEALGLVYLPMGMGSPDFYGINRSAQTDRFSSAVVALDADTGAVRWVFQAIHHDLWDYDLGAQPVLADFPTANGTVPALIQPTKTGQVFVLDRRTGKPLTRVEERPVPASTIPGERWSKTQPFSVGMPDFAGPKLTEADMWGISPFDQLYCRIKFRQANYQGIYTPLRVGPSIRTPGELGGIDWGSVSVDEGRGILVVNSNRMADYDELVPRAQADREHFFPKGSAAAAHLSPPPEPGAAMEGTPYAVHWHGFLTGLDIPCQRPPYGFLTAVDLKTRKVLWQHTLGDASNSGPFGLRLGLPFALGAPNIGGSIVTAGGVIFIAATQDQHFRAVDEASGKVLWDVRLRAGGHATPMTYRGHDGRQYVVLVAGGEKSFQTQTGDDLIAYRLKR
ncbi:MAG TPA: membrane-bound PQQ-dependent dehydrogenase, glucose/quinate/shikimate family [Rhizomicrobium sp.]|jgi:quinoprotein glucose dehydrogenase|nr:membrane-bound PQQ-dependent dehydrogenase, glucose/quinate/shikimate family [Rhizomicrobium sp.]